MNRPFSLRATDLRAPIFQFRAAVVPICRAAALPFIKSNGASFRLRDSKLRDSALRECLREIRLRERLPYDSTDVLPR